MTATESVHRRIANRASFRPTEIASAVSSSGTNWNTTDSQIYRIGPLLSIWIRATRTNTALTPNSEGDFSNETVCTLIADCQGTNTTLTGLHSAHVGRVVSGYYTATAGTVHIAASAGAGDAIDVGEEITLTGVVLADM